MGRSVMGWMVVLGRLLVGLEVQTCRLLVVERVVVMVLMRKVK